jgi:hypothetical protein
MDLQKYKILFTSLDAQLNYKQIILMHFVFIFIFLLFEYRIKVLEKKILDRNKSQTYIC